MKRILLSIIIGGACVANRASASEAICAYNSFFSVVGHVQGGAGFAFSPLTDISVTSLGYSGYILDSNACQVSLWDVTGVQLAAAVINSSAPLFNQSRYLSIEALTLNSGGTYYLQGLVANGGSWVGDVVIMSGPERNGTFSVAPEISYLGHAVGTNSFGVFPNSVDTEPLAYFVGPNFQFVIPEPAAVSLAASGLAAFALARRRRFWV
jgi:hypothetical protein